MSEDTMDNRVMADLVGKRVEVRSNSGDDDHCDIGVLEAFDYPWIRINDKGIVLCFPVHNVRLVKLLEKQPQPSLLSRTLLRPAQKVEDTETQQLLRATRSEDE